MNFEAIGNQDPGNYYGYACKGDSGAPVYTGGTIYGILVEGTNYHHTLSSGEKCYSGFYYTSMTMALNDMNVRL